MATNRQRLKEKGWIDFHLFLSPYQYDRLKTKADIEGVRMAELVRRLVNAHIPTPKVVESKPPRVKRTLSPGHREKLSIAYKKAWENRKPTPRKRNKLGRFSK